MIGKTIHLRQHYHFGPLEISIYLQRYHDISIDRSAVSRLPERLGTNRLPASQRYKRHRQRWKRYERQRPGHHVQIDVDIEETFADRPLVEVVTSMPGIGVRTGTRILLEVGDGTASASAGHLASYAGIAPITHCSGSTTTPARGPCPAHKTIQKVGASSAFTFCRDAAQALVQPDHGLGIAEARRDDVFAEHTAVDRGDAE